MPQRAVVFANNEIYHIFNRSIARAEIFSQKGNLHKIWEIVDYYRFPQKVRLSKFKSLPVSLKEEYINAFKNDKPLIEIYAFAFMPNHYHFLLKQLQDRGISRFMSNLQNSFAKVFNLKNERIGGLFQNPFKAKRIETDEQFIHVSRYIHLNPVTAYIIEFDKLASYQWTSFPAYALGEEIPFLNTGFLLEMFDSDKERYIKFVSDQVDYQRKLALIKDLTLESV